MTNQKLEGTIEKFDNKITKMNIELMKQYFKISYELNNRISSTTIIGSSILESIASYGITQAGYEDFGRGLAITSALGIAYGMKTLLTNKSKLAEIITQNQLGYNPKNLDKDMLNIVSEQ
jgi:hypothetical protein